MLLNLAKTNRRNPNEKLIIFDARSQINALANRLNNGGYENTKDYYTSCEINFCDIDNIHVVRDAYQKMHELGLHQIISTNENKWLAMLENTNWYQIIEKILSSANSIVETMKVHNVLVHCSDGWDRTAQLCCLV